MQLWWNCFYLSHSVQVVWDVTEAIAAAAGCHVLHRDVTPGNFGDVEGRGLLFDFSAGKVRWPVEWSRRVLLAADTFTMLPGPVTSIIPGN